MPIPDGYEAYIEVKAQWARMAGGTLAECQDHFEHQKDENRGCASRIVLADGTVVAERGIVGDRLRKQIVARVKHAKFGDDDAGLIAVMALLLGVDVDEAPE
jgi:hypothetical protein